MPSNKFEWIRRIKAVEREHTATRFATDRLIDIAHNNPTALRDDLRVHDLKNASDQLEGTYIIRLFAEFETSLRLFWFSSRKRDPPSRTRDLLDGVGAGRKIPHKQIQNAHVVREYRNALVHEREKDMESISIEQSRSHLCYYLNFLPLEW
jgi:hypothetical protein